MLLEAAWISPNVRALFLFHGLNDGTSCDLREVHESLLRSPSDDGYAVFEGPFGEGLDGPSLRSRAVASQCVSPLAEAVVPRTTSCVPRAQEGDGPALSFHPRDHRRGGRAVPFKLAQCYSADESRVFPTMKAPCLRCT